jgi:hypothetical protein
VLSIKVTAQAASRLSVPLPTKVHGHKLPTGNYRIVIVPADAAGDRGTPFAFSLTLRR